MTLQNSKTNKQNQIEWVAPEFNYYPKGKIWFLTTGIVAALLCAWAVWTANFLFALVIGLGYFCLAAYGIRKPRQIDFAVNGRGIKVGDVLYNYDDLNSFWIFYQPPQVKEISLHSKKKLTPFIKIPLADQKPMEVRSVLIKYLTESKHQESLIDNLGRGLGF